MEKCRILSMARAQRRGPGRTGLESKNSRGGCLRVTLELTGSLPVGQGSCGAETGLVRVSLGRQPGARETCEPLYLRQLPVTIDATKGVFQVSLEALVAGCADHELKCKVELMYAGKILEGRLARVDASRQQWKADLRELSAAVVVNFSQIESNPALRECQVLREWKWLLCDSDNVIPIPTIKTSQKLLEIQQPLKKLPCLRP